MTQEKSNREKFKDVNQRKRMDKVYQNLPPPTSFNDLKKHSEEFQEINARLKEETRKRKEKRELRKTQKEISEQPENDAD